MTADRRRRWSPLLTAVILLFLGLTAWSIDQARRKVSPVTAGDYDRYDLKFAMSDRERRAGDERDWTLSADLAERVLTIRVADAENSLASGGRGELVLVGALPAPASALPVTEAAPGRYQVRLPPTLAGPVTARLRLHLPDTDLQRTLQLHLRP